ncbi:nuclear pore complex protein Nup93-like [Asterias amurensis]|uniref:nuclear pore complex protein Nup93-like n=1 Tax=Asterias amurensis TaxID=7602 RepID=UPI003AB8E5DF
MDTDGFGDLLRDAEQLTANVDSGAELPRVERNLHQIMESSQRLWTKTAQVGAPDAADVKASILLGSKGIDVPRISQRLETLSTTKTFEPLEPIADTDIQSFLRNERENAVLAVIQETKKNTLQQTEKRFWETMQSEWQEERQKILNALISTGEDMIDIGPETESILNETVGMEGRSAMDSVEMAYARQVYLYNDKVVHGGIRPNLIHDFEQVSHQFDDKRVSELWAMVREMSSIPLISSRDAIQTRCSQEMQMSLIRQARSYLETSYLTYIRTIVGENLQRAQVGGIPGTYHLVQGFLKVKLLHPIPGLEDGEVDGQPVWPVIYYCLRCGSLDAVLHAVRRASQDLGQFEEYLRGYMENDDRRLSPDMQTRLRISYRRSVRNSPDAYKRAVYCLIGYCDTADSHFEVATKTEDYLWIKLSQVSFGEDSTGPIASDRLTLQQLQVLLLEEYGETHFSANQNPYLYFQVLFLCGQFEAAIEFLSRSDVRLRCHAVHVAIALYEMGLLILPQNIQTQVLSKHVDDPAPIRRLNLARLISMYTSKFENTDPREALQYFYILRGLKDSKGENLFIKCLSEMVIETREFDALLGRLGEDGTRRPGAVDKFQVNTQQILETVAKDTEAKGLFEDAVKLYDLASNADKVLEILNRLLSPIVSMPKSPQSSRHRLHKLAVAIAERFQAQSITGNQSNTKSFHLLLDLMTYFDQYHSRDLDRALATIDTLQLVPLTPDTVDDKVNAFKQYTDEVRRNMPDILVSTMNILHSKYRATRNSSLQNAQGMPTIRSEDGGKESYLAHLRKQAKSLITFAGMLPYRMPGDTNARLVQMEVLMN